MKKTPTPTRVALLLAACLTGSALGSSHMDAPLVTKDPAANTTDVYAFVTNQGGVKTLVTALGVYPHQEPSVGPNIYNFDDNVLYQIHVATGSDRDAGRATFSYQFRFTTAYKNTGTILQSYLGVVGAINDASQNLTQTYTVTRVDNRTGVSTVLGTGTVPPNNQGIATPLYNIGDNGNNPAKPGVATAVALDAYTAAAVTPLGNGYTAFAGQRDDGFYGDINSIFDLLSLRPAGVDSQGGFNIHLMSLAIPVTDIGGDQQTIGVYATTSRPSVNIVTDTSFDNDRRVRRSKNGRKTVIITRSTQSIQRQVPAFVQVGRQGNPLFNEALVAIADKDVYSRTAPVSDNTLFRKYAETPELAALINALVLTAPGSPQAVTTGRTDIAAIFIPDLIKVDLSTTPARLAGGGASDSVNPDDAGFSRLGIFGGDVLESPAAGHPFRLPGSAIGANPNASFVPGGWPNGRRFGDDVIDIAVTALISDLRTIPLVINSADGIDGVNANDIAYNKVFPYEGTPQNGRNRVHP